MFTRFIALLAFCCGTVAVAQEVNINAIANALAQGPVLCVKGDIVRARVKPNCPRNFKTVYIYQANGSTDVTALVNQLSSVGNRVAALEAAQPVIGPPGLPGSQGVPGPAGTGALRSFEFRIGNIDQELFPSFPAGRRTMRTFAQYCAASGSPDFGCATRSWGEACRTWGYTYGLLQDTCGAGWMRGPTNCLHSGWCFTRVE
jgi:hypothetical protein